MIKVGLIEKILKLDKIKLLCGQNPLIHLLLLLLYRNEGRNVKGAGWKI